MIRRRIRVFFLGALATVLYASASFAADSLFVKVEQIGGPSHWTFALGEGPIEIDPVPAGAFRIKIVNVGDTDITPNVSAHIWIMGFVDFAHSTPFLVGSYQLGGRHRTTRPEALGFESPDPLIIWIHVKDLEIKPTDPKPALADEPEQHVRKHRRHRRR